MRFGKLNILKILYLIVSRYLYKQIISLHLDCYSYLKCNDIFLGYILRLQKHQTLSINH